MIHEAIMVVGFFCLASFVVHWIVWRIKRPKAYPVVLPFIFTITPMALIIAWRLLGLNLLSDNAMFPLSVLLPYCGLCIGYVMIYAGVIEYSPSAEILLEVQKKGNNGLNRNEVFLDSLSEYQITGKRIEQLLASKLITRKDNKFTVTETGLMLNKIIISVRRLMGTDDYGQG